MPEHLYVDAAQMRASVAAVADARGALADAHAGLARAGTSADAGIDHSRDADDKIRTFVRQWCAELDLISEMLGAYTSVIEQAASSYEDADAAAAAEIEGLVG